MHAEHNEVRTLEDRPLQGQKPRSDWTMNCNIIKIKRLKLIIIGTSRISAMHNLCFVLVLIHAC